MAILTGEELQLHCKNIHDSFNRLRHFYSRGLLTDYEALSKLTGLYNRYLYRLLLQHRLRIDRRDEQWLRSGNTAADREDTETVQQIIHALQIPDIFFEPIPADILQPAKITDHPYFERARVRVFFTCADDDDLLSCKDPEGKSFILKDTRNLQASITVRSQEGSRLSVAGSLEGYTDPKESKEMELYVSHHLPFIFAYMEEEADLAVYQNYPLWQEYFAYAEKHQARIDKAMLETLTAKAEND